MGFTALMSSHLDKTTSQFFTCPCSRNLVLLNGSLFTVNLQDYFVLPSKLFSTSQYYTDLRLPQEYCTACYSVPYIFAMTIFWLLIPSKVYNYDHPSRFLLTLWIFVLADEISYRSHALPHNLLLEKSTSPIFF